MDEWRPIETAPKDGTRILAFGRLALEGADGIGTVKWSGRNWICDPNEAGVYRPEPCDLTRWMPLPAPPKIG